jgi:hypothetical protein
MPKAITLRAKQTMRNEMSRHDTPLTGLRNKSPDDVHGYTDFVKAAALIMTTRNSDEAANKAQRMGLNPRIIEGLTKATVAGGSVGGVGVSSFGAAINNAFMQTSRNYGFADEIAQYSMRFSDKVGRAHIYSSFAADTISEGAAKKLKQVTLTANDFDPVKIANMVVLTRELIDAMGDEGVRTLGAELSKGVAVATDTAFLTALSGNSTDNSIVATDWAAFLDMFDELLRLVDLSSSSRPYLIVTPELGKGIATEALGAGVDSISWNGGSIAGVQLRVSDGQTANTMTLVDPTGLATSMGELELRSSEQADIEMEDAPSNASATSVAQASMTSMFQTNSRCLRAERTISVKAVRTNAFFHMTGVSVGDDAGSPA